MSSTSTPTDPSSRTRTSTNASTTTRPSSKRIRTIPTAPKPPTTIDPTATIANHCLLTGIYPITIGARTVLHPYSKVISAEGPVVIAEGCVVWEKAVVGGVAEDEDEGDEGEERGIRLERGVVVETGAVVEGAVLGEGTVVEGFARVGIGARVGKFCKIMSYATVPPNSVVDDYTIVYGRNQRRTDTTTRDVKLVGDIKAMTHLKQLKGLQALIPSNLAKWQS